MAAPYPQVVLFGDSLFQGALDTSDGFCFQAALQKHCERRYDVINRGFSGYNTSQSLQFLEEVFPKLQTGGPKMKYLFILLGANDAALPQEVDNQAVPLDQYKRNLQAIITHPNITAHAAKIYIVTPPPLDEIRIKELTENGVGEPTRKTARSAAYSQAARDVAAAVPGTGVVDLQWELLQAAHAKTPGWEGKANKEGKGVLGSFEAGTRGYLEHYLPDGLHLSAEAYRVFWGLVEGLVEPAVPATAGTVGYVWPEWRVAPWLKE